MISYDFAWNDSDDRILICGIVFYYRGTLLHWQMIIRCISGKLEMAVERLFTFLSHTP